MQSCIKHPRAVRDLIWIAVFAAIAGTIAIRYELFEILWEISRAHDDWELDEIFSVMMFLPAALAVFAWRRWQEANLEVKQRALVEADLLKARDVAERASRAKSEFLANMSHEIRTPMSGIIGMTDLALDTPLTDQQREYLQTVRTSADALLVILNDILDFSRIEAGKLSIDAIPFSLLDVMQDCVRTVSILAHQKGLELLFDADASVPQYVIGDPIRVRQIMLNLIGNSVKFTERGEITFRARGVESADGYRLRFEIEDTGIGIPQEKLNSIFGAFSQADSSITRRFGGTGLGLSISTNLLNLMNGTISVTSTPRVGSTFCVEIPFQQSEPAPAAEPVPSLEELRGTKVLVVDDNATNRKILDTMLRERGLQVQTASGAAEAIEMLRAASIAGDPFQLVLTDFQMPGKDGLSLAREIAADPQLKSTAVMMLSSVDRHLSLTELEQVGVAAYLMKPVIRAELSRVLLRVFQLSRATAAPAPSYDRSTAPERQLRLLVAEDNVVNQRVLLNMVKRLGYTAVLVSNGRDAVQAVADQPFDLVLMDVQMPEMGGIEATQLIRLHEALRQAETSLPIIGVTANAMKGDSEACMVAGMNGYVAKPFKLEELRAKIEHVVRNRNVAATH